MGKIVNSLVALIGAIAGVSLGLMAKQSTLKGASIAFNLFQIIAYVLSALSIILAVFAILNKKFNFQIGYPIKELAKKLYSIVTVFLIATFFTFIVSIIVLSTAL